VCEVGGKFGNEAALLELLEARWIGHCKVSLGRVGWFVVKAWLVNEESINLTLVRGGEVQC